MKTKGRLSVAVIASVLVVYGTVIWVYPAHDFEIADVDDSSVPRIDETPTREGEARTAAGGDLAVTLSGGGYRAMLFHLGVLWRLNDTGYLKKLTAVSSVSGGSITAGVLASRWHALDFDENGVARRFAEEIATPLHELASTTIDVPAVMWGMLTPSSVPQEVASAYRRYLYGRLTLQDLPDRPRFIFNATNLQSGVGWRFSKRYLGDYRVGFSYNPRLELATVVAASSAFPPVLAPVVFKVNNGVLRETGGTDLHYDPYISTVLLADGGIDDNLGLGPITERYGSFLISDASGKAGPDPAPQRNWLYTVARVLTIVYDQPASLRKRMVVERFVNTSRRGTYISIRSTPDAYSTDGKVLVDAKEAMDLASIPTRLATLPTGIQKKLVNFGYAMADAGLRSHVDASISLPGTLPYPECPLARRGPC